MRSLVSISVLVLVLGGLAAAALQRPVPLPAPWTAPLAERTATPFPRDLPQAGGSVRLQEPPRRILAGSVFAAEVLLAICPPERIAAVHELAADPRYSAVAEAIRAFPRRCGASPEAMLSFRPDLVITDPFTRAETALLLERTATKVVRTRPGPSLADIEDNIRLLGYATGSDTQAEALVERMEALLAAVHRPDRHPFRVLCLDAARYTYGAPSTVDDLLRRLGARNVAAERGVGPYRRISLEQVLSWQPEVLLVPFGPGREEAERQRVAADPALQVLSCVQRGRVLFVPGALLASTSHHVAGAAERIAAGLDAWGHP